MREHRLYRPGSVSPAARLRTLRKALLLSLFTALTLSMLLENEKALALSLNGLNLWFEKMIPTLLPFMILSGIWKACRAQRSACRRERTWGRWSGPA